MVSAYAEVVAAIRATITAHAQAEDDGRVDDLVALYHPRGCLEIPGVGTVEGADALRATFASAAPKTPQLHAVVNTLVHDWSDHEAHATSDVVLLGKSDAGWPIRAVSRYHDTFELVDGIWLIRGRVVESVG
jgi:SnoaL-like protein